MWFNHQFKGMESKRMRCFDRKSVAEFRSIDGTAPLSLAMLVRGGGFFPKYLF